MKYGYRLGMLLAVLLLSPGAHAGDVSVEDAWARATAPGQTAGMADITLVSQQAASLVGISSPACSSVEMHSMAHENGMMKMRQVKVVELPAGKRVNLGESGYHLMLIGLKAPLKAGDKVPLTLNVELAGKKAVTVEAEAKVRPLDEGRPAAMGEMHKHGH